MSRIYFWIHHNHDVLVIGLVALVAVLFFVGDRVRDYWHRHAQIENSPTDPTVDFATTSRLLRKLGIPYFALNYVLIVSFLIALLGPVVEQSKDVFCSDIIFLSDFSRAVLVGGVLLVIVGNSIEARLTSEEQRTYIRRESFSDQLWPILQFKYRVLGSIAIVTATIVVLMTYFDAKKFC